MILYTNQSINAILNMPSIDFILYYIPCNRFSKTIIRILMSTYLVKSMFKSFQSEWWTMGKSTQFRWKPNNACGTQIQLSGVIQGKKNFLLKFSHNIGEYMESKLFAFCKKHGSFPCMSIIFMIFIIFIIFQCRTLKGLAHSKITQF